MDIRRIDASGGVWKTPESGPHKSAAPAKSSGRDRVELRSDASEGRNPAAGVERLARAHPEVRAERVEEVREKVESGHYNRPEVIAQVADRMVDDGFVG